MNTGLALRFPIRGMGKEISIRKDLATGVDVAFTPSAFNQRNHYTFHRIPAPKTIENWENP